MAKEILSMLVIGCFILSATGCATINNIILVTTLIITKIENINKK
jgi:hypothetical protein